MNYIEHIFFDTETTRLQNKEEELVSFPYILGFTTGDGVFVPVWWDKIESIFCKKIEEMLVNSKNKEITLVGFNVFYDIGVVLPFFDKYWNGKKNFFLDEKKQFISGDYRIFLNDVEYKINIEDLWIFDRNMSVRKWSEELGEDSKYFFDHDKWGLVELKGEELYYKDYMGNDKKSNLNDELIYLKRDVMILPKIKTHINNFKKIIFEETKVDESRAEKLRIKPGLTSASFAKYVTSLKMRRNFDECFRPSVNERTYRFHVRSLMGGYNSGNQYIHTIDFGYKNYKIVTMDTNSMYPHIFSVKAPLGRLYKTRRSLTDIEWVVISTKNVELNEKYSFLSDIPIKEELNNGRPWICPKRLYDALCVMLKTEIKVIDHLYSAAVTEISTMIKDLYKKRKKADTDDLTSSSIKLFLNSLFGKTTERTYTKHYKLTNDGLKKVINKHPNFRGILPGIYITGVARARLLEALIICVEKDKNIPLYLDTDSITFIEVNPTSLDIGTDLGQWKIEGRYSFFSRPSVKKKYLLEGIDSKGNEGIKLAVSGFDRDLVLNSMTNEQRRLLFSPDVNILWRRAKKYNVLNSLNQVVIFQIDVQTNESIPITHELIFKDGEFLLTNYDKQ